MSGKISRQARREVLDAMRSRYQDATKASKGRILDEVVALTGCHRKHAVRLMSTLASQASPKVGQRVYDEATREALTVLWEAADWICSKRLKAIIPSLVDSMESHGHLQLYDELRKLVLAVSPATIDRLLAPMRSQAKKRKKRRTAKKASKRVPVRTFADWGDPQPGSLEIDFVVHCGGTMKGSYIHSLVATDVCSGWTEFVPLLVREQSLVVEGLVIIREQFPVSVICVDSDNDSAFINDTLVSYCERGGLEFTRSRAYQKNDQAWIEQKNGAIIRKFVGYDRFSGAVAGQVMSQLYQAMRLYVNFFQPSFKLLSKKRNGSKVKKTYDRPLTPCDRLLAHNDVPDESKDGLHKRRAELDPIELLRRIRNSQSALAKLSNPERSDCEAEDLEEFLSRLPELWQAGEVRPTHRNASSESRSWRTRKDPFETVWPEVLSWLQRDPDATAKELFSKLQKQHPEQFADGQLRTLQRRIREWRQVMVRELVFGERNVDSTTLVPEPVSPSKPNDAERPNEAAKTQAT